MHDWASGHEGDEQHSEKYCEFDVKHRWRVRKIDEQPGLFTSSEC
jgi:hypothetical protein